MHKFASLEPVMASLNVRKIQYTQSSIKWCESIQW